MANAEKSSPFGNAKEQYVLDIDDKEFAIKILSILEKSVKFKKINIRYTFPTAINSL